VAGLATVGRVTILVDDAQWAWRGGRWAHLVSDESYDELHRFAGGLGKRRLGFQGDHYDVDTLDRDRAVDRGAVPVASRELVRRLRDAGLRNRTAKPAWQRLAEWPPGVDLGRIDVRLADRLRTVDVDPRPAAAALFGDPARWCLLRDLPPGHEPPVAPPGVHVGGPRVDGWSSVEIFVPRVAAANPVRGSGPHR
jgi:hypothetical protein